MANDNNVFQALGSTVIQRFVFGAVTLLLGLAGFLAKLEYNNIDERIDSNVSGIAKSFTEIKAIDEKFSLVRDEQIRRKGILDKVEADIRWLWAETDKLRADIRGTYELVLKNTKSIEDDARTVRERQMTTVSRVERIEDKVTRLEARVIELENKIRFLEERPPSVDNRRK